LHRPSWEDDCIVKILFFINRWLAIRLEVIANTLTFCTALFAVIMRDRLTAGIAGLTITYAMQITQSLNWLVRMTSDIETNIVSVERIHEYAKLEPEAPWEIPEKKPPTNWPATGEIQYVIVFFFSDFKLFLFQN
jgi:ABC-type multidrug transport system fused ATPase/permease subunit